MSEPIFITDQLQHVVAYNQNGRIIHTQASQTTRTTTPATRSTRYVKLIEREDHLQYVMLVSAQAETKGVTMHDSSIPVK